MQEVDASATDGLRGNLEKYSADTVMFLFFFVYILYSYALCRCYFHFVLLIYHVIFAV